MSIEGSFVSGPYTKCWGSLEWDVKIDNKKKKLDDFLITFKNRNQFVYFI